MQGNVCSKFPRDPLRQRLELIVGIVLAGNEQRRDLGPDIRLVNKILERIEDGFQRAAQRLA